MAPTDRRRNQALSEAWRAGGSGRAGLESEANDASRSIGEWCGGVSGRLAQALLRGGTRLAPKRRRQWLRYRHDCFRHWSRQQRAVKAVMDLEFEMANVTIDLTAACEQGLNSLDIGAGGAA